MNGRWFVFGAFAVAFLLLPGLVVEAMSLQAIAMWLFSAGAFLVLATPFVAVRKPDPFQPIAFILLTTLVGVPLRTLYILSSEDPDVRGWLMQGHPPEYLLPASILMFLAMSAFIAGYAARGDRQPLGPLDTLLRRVSGPWSIVRLTIAVVLLTVVAAAGLYLFLRLLSLAGPIWENLSSKRYVQIEGANQFTPLGYLNLMMRLSQVAFLLAFIPFAFSKRPWTSKTGVVVALLGLLAAFPPFFTSSRTGVLMVVILALVVWHYARRPVSMRNIAAFGVAGVVLVSFMGAIRSGQDEDLAAAFAESLQSEIFVELVDNFNFIGTPTTAHIMDAIPERLDYQYGSTMLAWVTAPIPRAIWADKPDVTLGQTVAQDVFGRPPRASGGIPPNVVSELYWNFGVVGVVAGMFLFGYLLRSLYATFRPHLGTSRGALMLYLFTVIPFAHLTSTGGVSQGIVESLKVSLPAVFVLLFVLARRRSQPVSAQPVQVR